MLIRDQADLEIDHGQNVQSAFPLADIFIDANNKINAERSINRFIELLFGHPFHTPTKDEYAMFHAKAAALRSADLSRQVGTVILSRNADILAVGTNEVPKAGGGLYWSDDEDDHRDFKLNKDTASEMRKNALYEVLKRLRENTKLISKDYSDLSYEEMLEMITYAMKGTQIMKSGEYGRTVHAEMAALIDAARRGMSIDGAILYTTTFPCHNCAKHIVASGISKVIYIEPYPKSLAFKLHNDSIISEVPSSGNNKLIFIPFVGVAPKRYFELFSMTPRKTEKGVTNWEVNKHNANPRKPDLLSYFRYLEAEKQVAIALKKSIADAGLM